jgi:hypothetical protein
LAQASEIQQFTEHCRKLYRDTLCGPTKRIERGEVLFKQFEEEAAALLAKPSGDDRALAERVNEMAVAKILADDPTITGKITYEPNMLPSGRKIDFVVEREKDNLYIEVKTVHPRKADTEAAWQLYLDRRPNHQPSAEFHVEKEWMGGAPSMETPSLQDHVFWNTLWISKFGWQKRKKSNPVQAFWFSVAPDFHGT